LSTNSQTHTLTDRANTLPNAAHARTRKNRHKHFILAQN